MKVTLLMQGHRTRCYPILMQSGTTANEICSWVEGSPNKCSYFDAQRVSAKSINWYLSTDPLKPQAKKFGKENKSHKWLFKKTFFKEISKKSTLKITMWWHLIFHMIIINKYPDFIWKIWTKLWVNRILEMGTTLRIWSSAFNEKVQN